MSLPDVVRIAVRRDSDGSVIVDIWDKPKGIEVSVLNYCDAIPGPDITHSGADEQIGPQGDY